MIFYSTEWTPRFVIYDHFNTMCVYLQCLSCYWFIILFHLWKTLSSQKLHQPIHYKTYSSILLDHDFLDSLLLASKIAFHIAIR